MQFRRRESVEREAAFTDNCGVVLQSCLYFAMDHRPSDQRKIFENTWRREYNRLNQRKHRAKKKGNNADESELQQIEDELKALGTKREYV